MTMRSHGGCSVDKAIAFICLDLWVSACGEAAGAEAGATGIDCLKVLREAFSSCSEGELCVGTHF
jgi:hypothetical protein